MLVMMMVDLLYASYDENDCTPVMMLGPIVCQR